MPGMYRVRLVGKLACAWETCGIQILLLLTPQSYYHHVKKGTKHWMMAKARISTEFSDLDLTPGSRLLQL